MTGKQVYKIVRWLIVAGLVIVVVLMLRRPAPAAAPLAPAMVVAQAQQFTAKLEQLKSDAEQGRAGQTTFTADEVNSFIADATVRAGQTPAPVSAAAPDAPPATPDTPAAQKPLDAATEQEIQAAVKKTQIGFEGDEVIAQAVVERYGQDIYVTVRGRLGVRDGYLAFDPTGFQIGRLSVPVSMVNDALQKRLADPENREKLKLPPFISDLRVENGQLTITQR